MGCQDVRGNMASIQYGILVACGETPTFRTEPPFML